MRNYFYSREKQLYHNRTPEEKRRLRKLLLAVLAIYLIGAACGLIAILLFR